MLKGLNIDVIPVRLKRAQVVRWIKPQQGKYKLNTDGSSSPGASGTGGLLRDANDNLIFAFSVDFGVGSNNAAELRAILYRLKICQEQRINGVEVETDSLLVVKWICGAKCRVWYLEDYWDEVLKIFREGDHSIQHEMCVTRISQLQKAKCHTLDYGFTPATEESYMAGSGFAYC